MTLKIYFFVLLIELVSGIVYLIFLEELSVPFTGGSNKNVQLR